METVIITIVSSIIIALLGWFVAGGRAMWDRRKVYRWLKLNTIDVPIESHVDTIKIAKGTRLSEDRVRSACISCKKIYHFSYNDKDQWSVWHKEPRSAYEGLSKDEIIDRMSY